MKWLRFGSWNMRSRLRLLGAAGPLAAALLVANAVGAAAGDERGQSEVVALGDATSAEVEIELQVGELRLAGGSLATGELLRGDFTYDDGDLAPEIDYQVDAGVGVLDIEQQDDDWISWSWDDFELDTGFDGDARWDIVLNPSVPTALDIELGFADGELVLGGLNLADLEVSASGGETTVDLAGEWQQSLSGRIEGDVDDLTLRLPRGVGVRVEVDGSAVDVDAGGLSEDDDVYVNDAYGTAPITIELDLDLSSSDVNLVLVD